MSDKLSPARADKECDRLYTLIAEAIQSLRDIKHDHPLLKVHARPTCPGSILNAYREGDLDFVEAKGAILEMQRPATNQRDPAIEALRDRFAAKAMQGMVAFSGPTAPRTMDELTLHAIAAMSFKMADAMLAIRDGVKPPNASEIADAIQTNTGDEA